MKSKQHILLFVILGLFALIYFYGLHRYKGEDVGLYENTTYSMNDTWSYIQQDGSLTPVTLPARLDVPENNYYSICNTIPEDFPEGMSLLFRTSQQSIQVFIDNELIYERGQDLNTFPGEFRGSTWNTFLILREYAGKKITITLMSPYNNISGVINEIRYGYKSGLLFYIIKHQLVQLVGASVMMMVGIILMMFHIVKSSSKIRGSSIHIVYLAIFAFFCSFFLFGESRMLQFYTSNEFLVTSISFFSEMVLPIPLFMYLKEKWMPQHRFIASIIVWVYTIIFVCLTVLQLLEIADLFKTMIVFHIATAISMMITAIIILIEVFKYHYKETYMLAHALIILIIWGTLAIIEWYHKTFVNVGMYLQIGIIGFEIMMAIYSIRIYSRYEAELREKNYYEKMAYKDALTDGKNRNAYMERIFGLSRNAKPSNTLCYALFDMNNLKGINDTYGHASGDEAIQKTYSCLMKAFGSMGDCYRIGGDEFAVIMDNCSEKEYNAAKLELDHEIEYNNQKLEYNLSLAGGYALHMTGEELNFEKLMRQADKMLYQNKHDIKRKFETS